MNKKIINGIISLVIVISATIGLSRLSFIERSVRILKTNNEENSRRGNFERANHGGREFRPRQEDFRERERSGLDNLPDSIRQPIITERGAESETDSLIERPARAFTGDRNNFGNRRPENNGRRGNDFRRGNNVRLANVSWFFIVFAGFTVITIYLDLLIRWMKRKNK